jgi:hypothetical protein
MFGGDADGEAAMEVPMLFERHSRDELPFGIRGIYYHSEAQRYSRVHIQVICS